MNEGWLGDEYISQFSPEILRQYEAVIFPNDLRLVGLRGWDEFIVKDRTGSFYIVPTVPVAHECPEPFYFRPDAALETDERLIGKVKWYIKPLAFGGDDENPDNITWVTYQQHAGLVVWWNNLYGEMKGA